MALIDDTIEILEKTHDGNDLSPQDLKLVEIAVNGRLNEAGECALASLLANARNGYKKPWLCGIEHLTIDHIGYVYWKDNEVEHYTLSWFTPEKLKESAKELARRCRILEERGIPVNTTNAIWKWED